MQNDAKEKKTLFQNNTKEENLSQSHLRKQWPVLPCSKNIHIITGDSDIFQLTIQKRHQYKREITMHVCVMIFPSISWLLVAKPADSFQAGIASIFAGVNSVNNGHP